MSVRYATGSASPQSVAVQPRGHGVAGSWGGDRAPVDPELRSGRRVRLARGAFAAAGAGARLDGVRLRLLPGRGAGPSPLLADRRDRRDRATGLPLRLRHGLRVVGGWP